MNEKRWRYVVLGVLLLLFALWLGSGAGWLHLFFEDKRIGGRGDPTTTDQDGEFGEENTGRGRKAVRDPSGKAKALLNIKAGETGVFRLNSISSGVFGRLKGEEIKGASPGLPTLGGFVGKVALETAFEQALRDGCTVSARLGDEDVTEYSAKNLYVKVTVVGKHGSFDDLRMEVRCKDSKTCTELTVGRGSAILFHLPEPDNGCVIVMRGKDEEGPAAEKRPLGE